MTTHTPWTVEGPKPFDGKADRNHLAYAWMRIVLKDGSTVGYTPDMPTATLFAAAPETAAERDKLKAINAELLAALKGMLEAHGQLHDSLSDMIEGGQLTVMDIPGFYEVLVRYLESATVMDTQARAAIAKAQSA